jgi:hypothetical protein
MKALIITFSILVYFSSYAQTSFEGEIIYQNYDEEMKPIDKTIYKIKGDKIALFIQNDIKNSIFLLNDSISFYKIGDEFKKSIYNPKNIDIFSNTNYIDTISNLRFNLVKNSNTSPEFNGVKVLFNITKYYVLDSSVKANYSSYQLPLDNQFGYLIKAKKSITKSEYFNKTTYSIFQSMTAKPIEDNEFEPE